MRDAVLRTVRTYAMLSPGERVVVGLSGGADSVCLLHLLLSLRDALQLTVEAVHVNHGIRGEEAARDERFCASLCEKWNVKLTVVRCDVPNVCEATGEGTEECARRLRYEALLHAAGKNAKIATAHNADDNAETVLLHLTRGAGLRGLCGIPPVRGRIIRPLLFCTRTQIEAYCRENALQFVTDSTNFCTDYSRNRVRSEVMPILKALNPAVLEAVSRMTAHLREDAAFINACADSAAKSAVTDRGIAVKELRKLSRPVAFQLLQDELQKHGAKDIAAKHIERIAALMETGGSAYLPGNVHVRVRGGYIEFPAALSFDAWELPIFETSFPAVLQTPVGTVQIQKCEQKDLQILHKDLLANAVDCAKIKGDLVLRSRKPGDSFTDRKRRVTKTLKKWFNEKRIPPEERNGYPVLSIGGTVAWVGGFGACAQMLPDGETKEFLLLTWHNGGNTNE